MKSGGLRGASIAQVVFFFWAGLIWALCDDAAQIYPITALAFALSVSGALKIVFLSVKITVRHAVVLTVFLFAADIAMLTALSALGIFTDMLKGPDMIGTFNKITVLCIVFCLGVAEAVTFACGMARLSDGWKK